MGYRREEGDVETIDVTTDLAEGERRGRVMAEWASQAAGRQDG